MRLARDASSGRGLRARGSSHEHAHRDRRTADDGRRSSDTVPRSGGDRRRSSLSPAGGDDDLGSLAEPPQTLSVVRDESVWALVGDGLSAYMTSLPSEGATGGGARHRARSGARLSATRAPPAGPSARAPPFAPPWPGQAAAGSLMRDSSSRAKRGGAMPTTRLTSEARLAHPRRGSSQGHSQGIHSAGAARRSSAQGPRPPPCRPGHASQPPGGRFSQFAVPPPLVPFRSTSAPNRGGSSADLPSAAPAPTPAHATTSVAAQATAPVCPQDRTLAPRAVEAPSVGSVSSLAIMLADDD